MFYICLVCLGLNDYQLCSRCGDDTSLYVEYRLHSENRYLVYAEGSYVGEIVKTSGKFDGETYLRFNSKERALGKLVVEEATRKHSYSPKDQFGRPFMYWTFAGNTEQPYLDWQHATKALFKAKGYAI